jgi:hypothetical protein
MHDGNPGATACLRPRRTAVRRASSAVRRQRRSGKLAYMLGPAWSGNIRICRIAALRTRITMHSSVACASRCELPARTKTGQPWRLTSVVYCRACQPLCVPVAVRAAVPGCRVGLRAARLVSARFALHWRWLLVPKPSTRAAYQQRSTLGLGNKPTAILPGIRTALRNRPAFR